MNIPYNNGKVQIGKYYVPPKYIETDTDMLELQSYLIYDPARLNKAYWTEKALLMLSLFVVMVVFLKSQFSRFFNPIKPAFNKASLVGFSCNYALVEVCPSV